MKPVFRFLRSIFILGSVAEPLEPKLLETVPELELKLSLK